MPDYDVGIERKKSVSSESAPVGKGSGLTSAGLERDDCIIISPPFQACCIIPNLQSKYV